MRNYMFSNDVNIANKIHGDIYMSYDYNLHFFEYQLYIEDIFLSFVFSTGHLLLLPLCHSLFLPDVC